MSKFDSGRFSGTRGSRDNGFRDVNGMTAKINEGQQGKHIIGHNNYIAGRSVLRMTIAHAQELVEKYGGTGEWKGANKESVNFHEVIGTYVSKEETIRIPTTRGIIHYGKQGCHIVPARPEERNEQ